VDETPKPLEERPFVPELGDALRTVVGHVRSEPPPAASIARALDRARRLGPGKVNPWLRYHRLALTAAVAAVLLLTFGLLLICWPYEPGGPARIARPGDAGDPVFDQQDGGKDIEVAIGVDHPRADGSGQARGDGRFAENPFVDVERAPISTFPLVVDAASYRDVRRALLEEKRLPPPGSVRVADLVNSFTYSYPEPTGAEPISLTLDLAECPWNTAHHLARIGLRSRADAATREARVQVAFNAQRVAAYRLIGYEGRGGRGADAAGETFGPGRIVTALYEVVPTAHAADAEWLTVQVQGRDPSERMWAMDQKLGEAPRRFTAAPADFRFAAAAAELGLLLRDSEYKGQATYAAVRGAARDALGADADGRRAEFLALVDAADRLASERKLTRRDAGAS
jgi:von Willebrand factor/Domain of unknown function (DUF3520)